MFVFSGGKREWEFNVDCSGDKPVRKSSFQTVRKTNFPAVRKADFPHQYNMDTIEFMYGEHLTHLTDKSHNKVSLSDLPYATCDGPKHSGDTWGQHDPAGAQLRKSLFRAHWLHFYFLTCYVKSIGLNGLAWQAWANEQQAGGCCF